MLEWKEQGVKEKEMSLGRQLGAGLGATDPAGPCRLRKRLAGPSEARSLCKVVSSKQSMSCVLEGALWLLY